ncbi:MAG TPA: phosphatase PAP2 family protein [Jatrophihabitantaceae bacterium]|nr:phosphatase PAP2 family protein [Jatrophihabitantaceae bacterium]
MDNLTIWVAQYLLYVMAAIFVAIWLFAERRAGRVHLAIAAVVGLICCGIFIVIAAHLHNDPRPFFHHPNVHPLFHHAADNGFPSDHSVAAGLIATLILVRHRLLGLLLWVCAAAIAAARVHAQVHHVQDVVAGLLLGALAALIGLLLARVIMPRLPARLVGRGEPQPPAVGAAHRA